ncbi:MAG: PHP domain-containing protein [Clostridia bacterium]|nr:PHP domain-containing protein [Clostridia bacterium]
MKFTFDHDLHIHSNLSRCSKDPEQTKENILQYALKNHLSTICITDHYWDSAVPGASPWYETQNFEHISQIKPLPKVEGVRFLFGCECEMDRHMRLGLPPERFDDFDFIIIPTTHLHMALALPEDDPKTPESRAKLWVERLDAFLHKDLPYHKMGVAHLNCCLMLHKRPREDYLHSLDLIPSEEMERLFARAAEVGVGIELNLSEMDCAKEEVDCIYRMFRIAKKAGCKFYFGSDAHFLTDFEEVQRITARTIDILDLQESDKFVI